jgi:hypothetical protein
VIGIGTPEALAALPESYTGQYLAPIVGTRRLAKAPAASNRKGRRKVA